MVSKLKGIIVIMVMSIVISACGLPTRSVYQWSSLEEAMTMIEPISDEMTQALIDRDGSLIYRLADDLIIAYGNMAGKPAIDQVYIQSDQDDLVYDYNDSLYFFDAFTDYIEEEIYQDDGDYHWIDSEGSQRVGINAKMISAYIEAMYYVVGEKHEAVWADPELVEVYNLDAYDPQILDQYMILLLEIRAIEGAEHLLSQQQENGTFPVYDVRETEDRFAPHMEALDVLDPDIFEAGYLVDDLGSGLKQYETSLGGIALLDAYEITYNNNYLQGAMKAGQFVSGADLVSNWHMNGPSVELLSSLYRITRHQAYLDAAIERATLGVLPGLMKTGRWVDSENALQTNHITMVKALLALWQEIPSDHEFAFTLDTVLGISLNNLSEEILELGVIDHEAGGVLIQAIKVYEDKDLYHEAVAISVNTIFDVSAFGTTNFEPTYDMGSTMAKFIGYMKTE